MKSTFFITYFTMVISFPIISIKAMENSYKATHQPENSTKSYFKKEPINNINVKDIGSLYVVASDTNEVIVSAEEHSKAAIKLSLKNGVLNITSDKPKYSKNAKITIKVNGLKNINIEYIGNFNIDQVLSGEILKFRIKEVNTIYVNLNYTSVEINAEDVKNLSIYQSLMGKKLKMRLEDIGNVYANINYSDMEINVEDVKYTTMEGSIKKGIVSLSDMGIVDLTKLIIDNATIKANDVKNLDICAKDVLSLDAEGVGAFKSVGKPKLKRFNLNK